MNEARANARGRSVVAKPANSGRSSHSRENHFAENE